MIRTALILVGLSLGTPALADRHNEGLRQEIADALEKHEIVYDVSAKGDSQLSPIQPILRIDDSRYDQRSAIIAIPGLN